MSWTTDALKRLRQADDDELVRVVCEITTELRGLIAQVPESSQWWGVPPMGDSDAPAVSADLERGIVTPPGPELGRR